LAAETPAPSESSEIFGYTAEVLKMDLFTKTFSSTGITFDPDGDPADDTIVKSYVYEINKRDDLAGKIGEVTFKYSFDDGNVGAWVFSGGGGAGLSHVQITDVDYTANNGDGGSPTYIYKTVEVDDPLAELVVSPAEGLKTNTLVVDGYPWNLKVGDNLVKIGSNTSGDLAYINNTICPEPIVKMVSGNPEVFDKEVSGTSFGTLRPAYRVMSGPIGLNESAYDDLFLIAQWSKRDQLVRINIPVI